MYALPYLLLARLHKAAIDARRKDRTWRYLMWSTFAGVLAGLMIFIGASFAWLSWDLGLWPITLFVVGAMVLPPLTGAITRHILVPAGWHRAAYWAATLGRPGADAPAYAACVSAWALSHRPSDAGEAWLAAKRDARLPLGDAEVAMTGFIAAGRGDAETARQLLRSCAMLVENHAFVRELAYEWLAVDAAERGAWGELAAEAEKNAWPATPLAFFLEGVAQRRTGAAGAPAEFELLARWMLAPYRMRTGPLLSFTPPVQTTAGADPDAEPIAAPDRAPLPRAVSAHLALGRARATPTLLAYTVHTWDAALADPATKAWLARRALELDAPLGAVDRALRDVAATVTDELARIAETRALGATGLHGPVADGLARRLRHGRLDALEAGFTRWSQRRHDGAVRLPIDEWREFLALLLAYEAAATAGGLELRRLAFPHAYSNGTSMAVWLWNSRQEYPLSHAISKWLLAEAMLVGDTEAIELGHRNCNLTVPTRTGPVNPG